MGFFKGNEGGSRGRSGGRFRDRSSRDRDSGNFDSGSRRSFGGRSGGRRDRFGGDRAPLEMHDVICSKCGKKCQVPFKPTSSKPVYCKECFSDGGGKSGSGMTSEQFDVINKKLDKIMAALEID